MGIDITKELLGGGISLEKKASDIFAAQVEDFARQKVKDAVYGATVEQGKGGTLKTWQSPKYAADMVSLAPKPKFMFKVHFHFNQPYMQGREKVIFTFVVKEIDKPKITYEYQKVNMYNFRTQVLTKITHETLSMSFHDDIGNYVHDFFDMYRRAYSPISRSPSTASQYTFENSGMDFKLPDKDNLTGGDYSASVGQLLNQQKQVLDWIEIEQFFGNGTKKNIFKFINPRIEMFDLDEADHSNGSDGNSMRVSFNYDALILTTENVTEAVTDVYGSHDIMSETPLVNFPGVQTASTGASKNPSTTTKSLFGNTLSSLTNFRKLFGKGGAQNAISAVRADANSAMNSGLGYLGSAVKNTLFNSVKGINQSTAGTAQDTSGQMNTTIQAAATSALPALNTSGVNPAVFSTATGALNTADLLSGVGTGSSDVSDSSNYSWTSSSTSGGYTVRTEGGDTTTSSDSSSTSSFEKFGSFSEDDW